MTRRSFIAAICATLLTARAMRSVGATRLGTENGVRSFERAIAEYLALRRTLEQQLPRLEVSRDPEQIHVAVEARAAAIRRARARARRGDIFNAEASAVFRTRIQHIFAGRPHAVADLLEEMDDDGGRWQTPVVNGAFSWETAAATPPAVLSALPALPDELQYRFVGPDLALVDADTNVVLDVLPGVLAVTPPVRRPQPA